MSRPDPYKNLEMQEDYFKVIELPVFQRLRRISQLSFSDFVYPNATHNRFSHSLGVAYLARIVKNYLKNSNIGEELELNETNYKAIEWAGLLHDIGHLPFSHVSEPAFAYFIGNTDDWKNYHVKIGVEILKNSEFGINEIIPSNIIEKVIYLIDEDIKDDCFLLNEIITGVCSIDRLDYLRRDAYHAGVNEYAIIDYERILSSITNYSKDPYLAPVFKKKALYALEGAILSYFYMYRSTYYHHGVRAAYLLFQDILWEAFEKYNLKDDLKDLLTPEFWNHFDDYNFLSLLHSKEELRPKLEKLLFRKLPKRVERINHANLGRVLTFIREKPYKEKFNLERTIKEELSKKIPELELILLDSPVVIPYPRSVFAGRKIYIWDENYNTEPENIAEHTPYLSTLADASEQQHAARIHVYPGNLGKNNNFINDLNSVIIDILR